MNDDWVELTDLFRPGEYVQDALQAVQELRIYSVDDEAVFVFLSSHMAIEHATRKVGRQWSCACAESVPCLAVAVLELRDYAQHHFERHRRPRS